MELTANDLGDRVRMMFCEIHNKRCQIVKGNGKCSCCNKKMCLCNYIL